MCFYLIFESSAKTGSGKQTRSQRTTRGGKKQDDAERDEDKKVPVLDLATTIMESSSSDREIQDSPAPRTTRRSGRNTGSPAVIAAAVVAAKCKSAERRSGKNSANQSPPSSGCKVNTPKSSNNIVEGSPLRPIPGYNQMNVKGKAKAYENHVSGSSCKTTADRESDSCLSSEEAKYTPKRQKLDREVEQLEHTPGAAISDITPQTPPTVRALVQEDKVESCSEKGDGDTPVSSSSIDNDQGEAKESKRRVSSRRSSVAAGRRSRASTSRRSRVSGARMSLSKRRSSVMRHKLRRSSAAVAAAKNTLMQRLGPFVAAAAEANNVSLSMMI